MYRCTQSIGWFSSKDNSSRSLMAGQVFKSFDDLEMTEDTLKRFKYEQIGPEEKRPTVLTSESFGLSRGKKKSIK